MNAVNTRSASDGMRTVICDIETDSLQAKIIHCICCLDVDTREVFTFTNVDKSSTDWTEFSKTVGKWIGHNFLGFDAPVINKLTNARIKLSQIEDTLILSRIVSPIRKGGHSLKAWGNFLGNAKIEFDDFSKLTQEMIDYCKQDLYVCEDIRNYLMKDLIHYSKHSIDLEHRSQHILNKQSNRGFYLDVDKAMDIYNKCDKESKEIESRIQELFPPIDVLDCVYTPKRKKDGKLTAPSKNKILKASKVTKNPDGTLNLYKVQEFNLGSQKQIIERLKGLWKPTEFTPTGNPKVCEENFNTVVESAKEAKELGRYLMLQSRMRVVKNWLDFYNPATHRVHGQTISLGASTHRMAHRSPQMGNIPGVRYTKEGKLVDNYGSEMRECWTVEDTTKWKICGTDIAGIQLCLLAHFMEDKQYIDAIENGDKSKGTDIHSVNMRILQETFPSCTRDNAKTFIYALLFGAAGKRLGQIFGADAKMGQKAKDVLFDRIPGFKKVEKMCKECEKRGYHIGIDGRRIATPNAHFALPAMLQGNEATVMKKVMELTDQRAKHLTWNQVAVVHDEMQAEVLTEQAVELGAIQVQAIKDAGKFYKLKCKLDGETNIGNNWRETH